MAEADKTPAIVNAWYQSAWWLWLLLPFSWLFRLIASVRRWLYQAGILSSYHVTVPVIVVGNISVGGTGKTPLVVALITRLQKAGFKPGVVSRGYGSQASQYPHTVNTLDTAELAGDEPLLIVRRTGVPVVIGANRGQAVNQLLMSFDCDVVVTDDGLQHYALQRDIECVVVDSQRGFGNKQCLPVGPLREPLSRLKTVNFIIANGGVNHSMPALAPTFGMELQASTLTRLTTGEQVSIQEWLAQFSSEQKHSGIKQVHALAGIGNPNRFFTTLRGFGFEVIEHVFADHYAYQAKDINFGDKLPIIMTEKDAVKIQPFADERCWYLAVDAAIDEQFYTSIIEQLKTLTN